jgi:hypothetical protein
MEHKYVGNGMWRDAIAQGAGCRHLHAIRNRIERHLQQHPNMRANIEALGWFWGIIRTIIREKPRAMIAEVLGEGEAYQCTVAQCGNILRMREASRPISRGTIGHGSKKIRQSRGANWSRDLSWWEKARLMPMRMFWEQEKEEWKWT